MNESELRRKLEEIQTLTSECLGFLSGSVAVVKKSKAPTKNQQNGNADLSLAIVNKIGDCEECDLIEQKILSEPSIEPRLLLSFYISYKYFNNEWLSSGNVQAVTSELGIKIDTGNASNYIKKKYRQYFESDSARKKGRKTCYRLNRKGKKRFEELLYGNEKED